MKNVMSMIPVIEERSQALLDKFTALGTVEDVRRWFQYLTTDVICETSLGIKFHYIENAEVDTDDEHVTFLKLIQARLDEQISYFLRKPHTAVIAKFAPRWLSARWDQIRIFFERTAKIHKMTKKVVKERMAHVQQNPTQVSHSLMEQAIRVMDKEGEKLWSQEDKVEVLQANVSTFWVAGSETTANTLSWLFHHISSSPEWHTKCRDQVLSVMGSADCWASLPGEKLWDLTLLRACLNETNRLSPTIPLSTVNAGKDLEWKGQHIPAGTQFMLLVQYSSRKSVDRGDEWLPHRWLDEGGALRSEDTVCPTLVFGSGPRVCPGRTLAELEILVLASLLLRRFPTLQPLQPRDKVRAIERVTSYPRPFGLTFA